MIWGSSQTLPIQGFLEAFFKFGPFITPMFICTMLFKLCVFVFSPVTAVLYLKINPLAIGIGTKPSLLRLQLKINVDW